jgi:hypothetical protein
LTLPKIISSWLSTYPPKDGRLNPVNPPMEMAQVLRGSPLYISLVVVGTWRWHVGPGLPLWKNWYTHSDIDLTWIDIHILIVITYLLIYLSTCLLSYVSTCLLIYLFTYLMI